MEVRSPVCRLHTPSPLLNLYLSRITMERIKKWLKFWF